ncbi:MAG: FG-GAP-like repeat-containing protein [Candidatus Sulfotelmatobacter sp.]
MAADFNHDGRLDLAEQGIAGAILVLLGKGDGTFQKPLVSSVGETTSATTYTVADLNGDGALDLIAGDTNLDTVDVFMGNGNGTFGVAASNVALAPDSYGPDAGIVADFNDDGKPDLLVAEVGFPNGQISVQLGNGDGTFQQPIVSPLTIEAINNNDLMIAGDFNGDGKPDVVIMDDYAAGFEVLLGNGDGTFQTAVNTPVSYTALSLAVGDFNLDGKADVITTTNTSGATGSMNVYLSNGDGTFHAGPQYAVPLYSGVVVRDVNKDGKPDLIVASFGGPLEVFLGNGDGTFKSPISGPSADFSGVMVVKDFNGDGNPDIAVGTYGGMAFLAGNGDGTFQTPVYSACGLPTCSGSATQALGYSGGKMVVGDFNGDGKLDLATYPPFDTTLSGAVILIGNGDGTFQEPYPYSAAGTPADLLTGDFNSDGISDLAMPNMAFYGPNVSVVTLYLSGPTLDFFPGTLTFGTQNSGATSSPQSFKLTNLGPGALSLNSIEAAGQFSETNDCGTGLNKTQACEISVTFTPTGNGPQSGTVNFSDNFAAGLQTVTLAGTGYGPFVGITPTTLTFAGQFVGSSSSPQAVTLMNQGPGVLTPSIQITGDFNQTNNCGSSLAVGNSCVIQVTFQPATTGTRTGALTFVDNAAGAPQSIPLAGVGASFALGLASGASGSATITAGATATYNLTIGGAGFAGAVDLTCTGAPTTGANCAVPASVTLSATTPSALTVTVTTTSRTTAALSPSHRNWFWAFAVFALLWLPTVRSTRSAPRRLRGAALLLLTTICSCGGGGSSSAQMNPNGTPAGQYSLTITASAGSNTQSLPLKLIVQ